MKTWWSDILAWRSRWQPFRSATAAEPALAAAAGQRQEAPALSLLQVVQSPTAEQVFADLYDHLRVKWRENTVRLVTVCAAAAGDGASTVALGLALAATRDPHEKVLLVDGNFHHPSLSQVWKLEKSPGLSDYLTGKAELAVAAQPTIRENLRVLASGSKLESHAKLLDAHLLGPSLQRLAADYSLVILDSPAASQHPEAPLYAHFTDRILLVVAAGRSRAPVVQYAISKFPVGLRERLEVVLNRRTYPIPRFIYHKLWSY